MLCRKKAESYSYFQIMGVWLRICVQVMLIIYEKILSMKKKMLTYLNIQYIILTFVVNMRKWRNWQTRRLQVPVVAIPCGFKSHLLHFLFAGSLESEGFPFFHFLYSIYCKINSAAFSIPIFPVSIQRSYSLPSPQRVAVHCS